MDKQQVHNLMEDLNIAGAVKISPKNSRETTPIPSGLTYQVRNLLGH